MGPGRELPLVSLAARLRGFNIEPTSPDSPPSLFLLDESTLEPHSRQDICAPESGGDSSSLAIETSEMSLVPGFPHQRCRITPTARYLVQGMEISTQSPPRTQIQKLVPGELRASFRPRERIAS